ncbi:Retrovirus-related Pol polyprotein from transposon TNT 1-94 [Vitis vinifera]|uniref:Retrovirus-related Pol polyprotein from transposon TNT 1-94 n=1 Tax=Vitis vinifera TaxID=29760 RepID=A0A438GUX5_VITVI|nr:Retrovirus-related Pol polyprotein from transposon TNT 1-94 [Vitis vinifera]
MLEGEPQTFKEAVNSIEGLMWKEAIKSEIDSILQNHTWELVDLPPGCKPLSSKWIFKRKMKVDGSIDKYKARLVIKGDRQTEGLDYFDTYSPVTRINSIRMVLAIAALRNLEIHQMDVKTAFLNGDLDEEIYMEQPEGFSAPGQEKKVCKLVKSLYGLKQAPKQWHEKFDNVMLSHGFKINECDKCVYVKDTEHGYVIVCLYVDDMLIVGSDDKMITSTKNMLNSRFDMKDMGLADVILGIKIKRTSDELILSQSHYVDKILGKFDKDNSGVARTPVDVTLHLSKNKGESVSQVEYSRVIGSLMYLMSCTRPDIAYAVSKLSRYTSNPGAKHWQEIIRVLKYLRFTRDYGQHYTRYPAVLEGYSDANWISNVKDSKSHSGYVFTLGGAVVSWKSSKQTVIARSTMESEFIALDKCGEEAEWLRHFLEDIPRWSKPVPPICIHCDSQSAIGRAQSNMYNGKSRHIRRRHNTIRQLLSTGVISVDYVKSKDNIADPLTKGLNRKLVEKSSRGMRLKPIKE